MGRDKALLQLEGETLVARALRSLAGVCADVAIAGGAPELERLGRVIVDGHPGCGPLGGIVAALEASTHEWNCFLAVDVPFVPLSVWQTLLARAEAGDAVAVLAEANGFPQPLVGVYAKRALPVLREHLEAGSLKVMQVLRAAGRVELVGFQQTEWFRNVNTPEEYAELAEKMVCEL